MAEELSAEGAALNQRHIAGHIRFDGSRAGQGVLLENPAVCDAHSDCQYIQ